MRENIITIKNLKKTYKVSERDNTSMMSSVKSLFKRKYKYVSAVNNINLSVKRGEIRGLIGPNGAGKSTTIKMLSGILHPTEGIVEVLGHTPWNERESYVMKIGAVFGQKSQLWWDLPPIDTFSLNRHMYKISDKTFNYNIDMFKELLDIEEVIKKPTRQLSLGERMKCEFVCALLHEPELVYLDEPTIGLDIITKDSIRTFIKELNRVKNTTIIITTHDLDDIVNLCENVTIINNGTVVYDETLENLTTYFDNTKVIEIKFTEPVKESQLDAFNVLSATNMTANIEVNLTGSTIKDEVSKLFATLPVHDININNIDIEEVIKHIYST